MSVGFLFLQLITFLCPLASLFSSFPFKVQAKLMADLNIVMNGDFFAGIEPWYPNGCEAFVVSSDPFSSEVMSADSSSGGYVVVTNRKETWQGLEQDITTRVASGMNYTVSTCVGVSGPFNESAEVLSTVRLEHEDSPTEYLCIGKYVFFYGYIFEI
jgi:hypothetical protein